MHICIQITHSKFLFTIKKSSLVLHFDACTLNKVIVFTKGIHY